MTMQRESESNNLPRAKIVVPSDLDESSFMFRPDAIAVIAAIAVAAVAVVAPLPPAPNPNTAAALLTGFAADALAKYRQLALLINGGTGVESVHLCTRQSFVRTPRMNFRAGFRKHIFNFSTFCLRIFRRFLRF